MDNKVFNTRIVKNQFIDLLKRRLELEPEYLKLQDELDNLNRQISGLDQALKAAGIDTYALRQKVRPSKPAVESAPKPEVTIPKLIYSMLQAYKKPLHYKEIHHKLHTDGYWIKGKDPANTVLAYISRNKNKFEKAPEVGRGYYKIKE
ncbi:hypothetical protein ACFLYF_01530 [Chloroflexota bacterium]